MTSCVCDSTVVYISKLPDLKPVDWMRACLVVIACLFILWPNARTRRCANGSFDFPNLIVYPYWLIHAS